MGDKDVTIATFASITGSDFGTARFYLEMNEWNLERATESFYDQGGVAVDPGLLNWSGNQPDNNKKKMDVDVVLTIRFKPDKVGEHLQAGFGALYKSKLFTDVVLVVNGIEKFPVHKVVISSWSDVLRALVSETVAAGGEKEGDAMDTKDEVEGTREVPIELEDRLAPYVPLLLEYMYTGTTKVALTDLVYMIELATRFNVSSMKDSCGDILFANSKEIDYLLDLAQKYGCSKLENQCSSHIANNWEKYQKSGELMSLTPSTWEELLKSDDISAYEEDIFVAVMIYVGKYEQPENLEVLERLLPWVRLPLMSEQFLEQNIATNQLLQLLPITHELLHEAYRYKLLKSERTITHRCKPRKPTLRWSKKDLSPGLKLSEDQMTVSFSGKGAYSNQWLSVCTESWFTSGVHTFECKINSCVSNWLFVGVAGKNWKGWTDVGSGYLGYGAHSWAYGSAAGWGKASNMQHHAYGATYKSGDVIRVTVDLDRKTISFMLNGRDYGVAWSNLEDQVRPAVTLYQQGDSITLRRAL